MTLRRTGAAAAWAMLTLLAILGAGCARSPSAEQKQAWSREIARLEAEQDSLRRRTAELIAADGRIQRLPRGDVVVAVPTSFVREVVETMFRDVVSHITLNLSGLKVHKSKTVKKLVTVGEFTVDVDVTKVVGQLRPGQPAITFGGDRISLSLPVSLARGEGEAQVRFVWNGKNVADLTCGDMDVTRKVSGSVVPADYVLSGALSLVLREHGVVGSFQFPETRLRIRVKPSQAAWDTVNALLAEKEGVCGWVLDKVNVPELLGNVVEGNGFNVKLPLDKLKPVTVPGGIQDSVTIGGRALAVSARTNTLRIDPDAIWYSADVRVESPDR